MYGTDVRDRDSSCPSPPSSLRNYPLHHHSQFKPTSTPYSGHLGNGSSVVGHAPLLGHSLITGSNSSIRSAGSAHSHLDGYSYSRPSLTGHSRVQGPFSSTPSYLHHDNDMDVRRSSSRGRYNTSSHSNHTSSSLSPADPTSLSHYRTLTPSDPGSGTSLGREKNSVPHKSEPTSPDMELQRSKLKVKQLEREVRTMFWWNLLSFLGG